jgi:hypothetical protein
VGRVADGGNPMLYRLTGQFVGAVANSAASSADCGEDLTLLALAPLFAREQTDSWLLSPLLNTIFQIPVLEYYNTRVATARAAGRS